MIPTNLLMPSIIWKQMHGKIRALWNNHTGTLIRTIIVILLIEYAMQVQNSDVGIVCQ